jgi:hypothetical protein
VDREERMRMTRAQGRKGRITNENRQMAPAFDCLWLEIDN